MTYFNQIALPSLDRSQGIMNPPSSIAVNQTLPFSSFSHNNLTVNASGQLVLDAGYTFVLSATSYQESNSAVASYKFILTVGFYDVTNSLSLGRDLQTVINKGTNTFGSRGCLSRCVIETTAQTTVECRIVGLSGTANPNNINQQILYTPRLGNGWFSVLSF
jgi:hypothetical protein